MKTVTLPTYGGPNVLTIDETPKPVPAPHQLLVRVRTAGVNRADALQRQGVYPMPPGISNVPGLELAGEVESVGSEVTEFAPGERVFGLVEAGAYAEYALLDRGLAVPLPEHWGFIEGAAVIEVFCTAHETVFGLGELAKDQSVLIYAGASGVGTAAVQMAKHAGATVYFTAGSRRKIDRVLALGADMGIDYKGYDVLEEVLRATEGEGVDVIEDFVGASQLMRNLSMLKPSGRLILVGLLGGGRCDFDLGIMLRKRLKILGFTLRAQPLENKRAIVGRFRQRWLPLLAEGTIKPVIHASVPFAEVRQAHEMMEADENVGKIVLTMD